MEHGRKIRVVTQKGTFYLDVDGRPDGAEAILPKYLKKRAKTVSEECGCFFLDDSDVQQLSEEAFLYRLRREYFFKVGDFARCIRDVNTGIQIIELITAHASNPDLSIFFMQFRPDQEIFRRTAEAKLAIKQKDYSLARQRIELAGAFIREFASGFKFQVSGFRFSKTGNANEKIGDTMSHRVPDFCNSFSDVCVEPAGQAQTFGALLLDFRLLLSEHLFEV
ncbi:MAG: hypothetical protein HY801_06590 [Candidatus Lindowbacteria bacterium]|nr:hypothetical protein [Candidatus Lindowbacteria bacterium]